MKAAPIAVVTDTAVRADRHTVNRVGVS
jgi:hypothetical protein